MFVQIRNQETMGIAGSNRFVLEGRDGKDLDMILSHIEGYKNKGKKEHYVIGTCRGLTFEILDEIVYEDGSAEYLVVADDAETGDVLGASYIDPNTLYVEGNALYLSEICNGIPGVLETLFSTCMLYDAPGFYFMASNEWHEAGATNDREVKYFERSAETEIINFDMYWQLYKMRK